MHFATALPAAAAGPVSGVFGALGFRAEKGQVLKAAVPALPAGKKHFFCNILEGFCEKVTKGAFFKPGAEILVYARKQRIVAEKGAVDFSVYPKQHFFTR